ncbi:MAG TPA: DNA gyrase inhibitor YacG [Vicinamibacterales bacterium]|nr:DNA gyrase inhibitor YacG [Vicinamibacterales bacterium]
MACRPLCAYCRRRPMEAPWAPFCSQRCKDVDLGRWLKGDYRIAGDRPQLPDEAEMPDDEEPVERPES